MQAISEVNDASELQYMTDWRECAPPELRKFAHRLTRLGLAESLQHYVARMTSRGHACSMLPLRVLVMAWRFEAARLLGLRVGTRGPVDDPNMPACEIEEECTREEWVEAGMQFLGPVPEGYFEPAPAQLLTPRSRRQARKMRREAERRGLS